MTDSYQNGSVIRKHRQRGPDVWVFRYRRYNPEREIAYFRQFPGWQTADLKAGEQRNQNGVYTVARRCVYGYWKLEEER